MKEPGDLNRICRRLGGVAQLGRALRSGRRGRTFKSCRPDHTQNAGGLPAATPRLFSKKTHRTTLFQRFSPSARRVLRVAEQECRNHNHYYLGAEHVLEALLQERDPAILSSLAAHAVDAHTVHAEIRRSLVTGDDRLWEGILVTPRVRKIVEIAEQLAADREVEPFDLFLALQREGGGLAAQLLRRAQGSGV